MRASFASDLFAAAENLVPATVERSVVLFRIGDLRVRDHAGLTKAGESTRKAIVPLFVVTPNTPPQALRVLERLRQALQRRRADLVVRFAPTELQGTVDFITNEFPAQHIHIRYDPQADFQAMLPRLSTALEQAAGTEVRLWYDDLREEPLSRATYLETVPTLYPEYLRSLAKTRLPVQPSTVRFDPAVVVPGLPADVEPMPLSFDDINARLNEREEVPGLRIATENYDNDSVRLFSQIDETETDEATPDLHAEALVQHVLTRMEQYESVDIARALGPLLWFGEVSSRRMHELVIAHERVNGRIFRPLYRLAAKTMLAWLDAREFAAALAERDLSDETITVDGVNRPKFWRWRGHLVRYVETGAPDPDDPDKPAILLIHGFGASSQHWGRNVGTLGESMHVFAVCLVGFGRTEKPPFIYTQYVWELFVAEFVRDVIGRRVFIAGNSIGGYISCAFASDMYPSLCAGACLVNSAGTLYTTAEYERIRKNEAGATATSSSPVRALVRNVPAFRRLFSSLLLLYLRGNIGKTLARAYPTVDPGQLVQLTEEIYRNSLDRGALDVLMSGFILPPQRPLNELLETYDGPLLIFQGVLDPLGNPVRKARTFEEVKPSAQMKLVEAGHCPHDEMPATFNSVILDWTASILDSEAASVPDASKPLAEQPRAT